WQWSASTTTAPASQSVVPNPSSYTIEFKNDGMFAAKADCNQVSGNYTTSGSNLTIVPGPSTLVACPDDSMADLYLEGLSTTQSYAITDSQLVLTTTDGTMTFDGSIERGGTLSQLLTCRHSTDPPPIPLEAC